MKTKSDSSDQPQSLEHDRLAGNHRFNSLAKQVAQLVPTRIVVPIRIELATEREPHWTLGWQHCSR